MKDKNYHQFYKQQHFVWSLLYAFSLYALELIFPLRKLVLNTRGSQMTFLFEIKQW